MKEQTKIRQNLEIIKEIFKDIIKTIIIYVFYGYLAYQYL